LLPSYSLLPPLDTYGVIGGRNILIKVTVRRFVPLEIVDSDMLKRGFGGKIILPQALGVGAGPLLGKARFMAPCALYSILE
jgi:hypothetical protein